MTDVERCGDHNAPLPCVKCDRAELVDDIGLWTSLGIALMFLIWLGVAAWMARHP